MAQTEPDLAQYMNKVVVVQLSGSRKVQGTLKGYDMFLNIVLESAVELSNTPTVIGTAVVRGESVLSLQAEQ